MAALKINTYHGKYNLSVRSGGLGAIATFNTHYTGGKGSAKNNCIFFATADRRASADWFIDKDGTIWEYNNILDGYFTWAVGDGAGKYGIWNRTSVNVEVVSNGEAFTEAQIESLAALYAHVCNILGRKLKVVRHYDASRKHCPAAYIDAAKWASLKKRIEGGKLGTPAKANKPASPSGKPASTAKPSNKTKEEKVYNFATVKSGSKGKTVRLFQAAYNARYGGSLAIDGSAGPATVKAIKDVQKRNKIAQDGSCGPNTWKKMFLQ